MRLLLLALALATVSHNPASGQSSDAAVWATAVSKHESNGRQIIFRYVKDFRPGFERSSLPDRVILVWRYDSQSGMPAATERAAMDRMEDLIAPVVEKPGVAVLALVSTGEGLREWTYYAKDEHDFLKALNRALMDQPRFPIEVHAGPDPKWLSYETFRKGVRE